MARCTVRSDSMGAKNEAVKMADDAQNRHESLMKTICGRLMAGPFVFFPDEWKLHPQRRESRPTWSGPAITV